MKDQQGIQLKPGQTRFRPQGTHLRPQVGASQVPPGLRMNIIPGMGVEVVGSGTGLIEGPTAKRGAE